MKAERPENHTKIASGGLLGGLWGLAALGASFGAPGAVFWRLGSVRGESRAGSLKKARFGTDVWSSFGAVFDVLFGPARCLADAVF